MKLKDVQKDSTTMVVISCRILPSTKRFIQQHKIDQSKLIEMAVRELRDKVEK